MNNFASFTDTPSLHLEKALKKTGINPNCSLIKVTGSNGKSITSSILMSLYSHAGYKVGALLHHYLDDADDNLLFNNKVIPTSFIESSIKKYQKIISKYDLSKFEVMTLIFLAYLEENKADIAIIELDEIYSQISFLDGMNEILSIVTSLTLDHTEELGSTLSLIASSYASNFSSYSKILIPKLDDDIKRLFFDMAKQNQSTCFEVDSFFNYHLDKDMSFLFSYRPYGELKIASSSISYLFDASLALEAININKDIYPVSKENIEEGLLDLINLDEGVRKADLILSSASNLEALTLLSKSLATLSKGKPIHCLLSLHEQKNISSILSFIANVVNSITFTRASSNCRDEFGYSLYLEDYPYIDSPLEAYKKIKETYPDDVILACGCHEIVEEFK